MKIIHTLAGLLLTFSTLSSIAEIKQSDAIDSFIEQMHTGHQFDRDELKKIFASVEIKDNILKSIAAPAEVMPWYKYRKIFLTDVRIEGGVNFWKENQLTLASVEQQYGVPAEIIIAIIGVETRYGTYTGHYRVIDALSTLGFNYPKRSKFFLKELENFLLLCREENIDPLQPTGSYAGAMGMPQFMPSSYRAYATDHDGDKKSDIWNNTDDVISSVANYFSRHRWRPGDDIAFPTQATGDQFRKALTPGLKPDLTIADLHSLNILTPDHLDQNTEIRLLEFEQQNGADLWITLHNFYVITRYNHSPLYAMAVYQLSQAILDKKNSAL